MATVSGAAGAQAHRLLWFRGEWPEGERTGAALALDHTLVRFVVVSEFEHASPISPARMIDVGLVVDAAGEWAQLTTGTILQDQPEAVVEQALELYRLAFETTPIGMCLITPDRQVIEVNSAMKRILGLRQEEEFDAGWIDRHTHPDDRDLHVDPHRRLMAGEINDYHVEKRYLHSDGRTVWTTLHVAAVPGRDGKPVLLVSQVHDVTTQVLAVQQAQAARVEAERASRAKTEFLSRVSHELRTPLNAIVGFAQLMAVTGEDPQNPRRVDSILRAGEHLAGLIDDVLKSSQIESGVEQVSIEPIDVGSIVRGSVEMASSLAGERGIEIEIRIEPAAQYVLADLQRLRQVLLNLLGNAIKYNREGGHVDVAVSVRDGRTSFAVTDTGYGIDPSYVERVFLPFERVPDHILYVQGTGLGLPVARGLSEAMGGTLRLARSTVGVGSTFVLELEAAVSPVWGTGSAGDGFGPSAGVGGDLGAQLAALGSAVVLYADDNPANTELVSQILERSPAIETLITHRGSDVMPLVLEREPDVVLLDLHLPDLDGRTVLRQLSHDPRTRDVPVIIVSADALTENRSALIDLGATDYLVKPFRLEELVAILRRGLRLA